MEQGPHSKQDGKDGQDGHWQSGTHTKNMSNKRAKSQHVIFCFLFLTYMLLLLDNINGY